MLRYASNPIDKNALKSSEKFESILLPDCEKIFLSMMTIEQLF